MARDPFSHHPETGELESTTAMTSVSASSLKDVGRRAAKMVDKAAHPGEDARPAGRKTSRRTVTPASASPSEDRTTQASGQVIDSIAADTMRRESAPTAMPAVGTVADTVNETMYPGRDAMVEAAARASEVTESVAAEMREHGEAVQHDVTRVAAQTVGTALDTVNQTTDTVRPLSADADAGLAQVGSETGHGLAAAVWADAAQAPSGTGATLAELNARLAEAMRANIDATMSFWSALIDARSVSEAAALNAQHVRRQMEVFAAQSRDLAGLTQKLALDAWRGFAPRA